MKPVRIFCDDCLAVLSRLEDARGDLAYLDPPFNTGRPQRAGSGRFNDAWPSPDAYLAFLRPRVEATLDALHGDGAILVHCDWRTCHHIRIMLDEVLGPDAFVNHIIWHYGLGGSSARRFARKHDDILFYAKSDDYYFAPPKVPATSQRMRGRMKKATDVLSIPAINNMAMERTGYPTQKPLALLRVLIRACAPEGGLVIDPFCGSGTTLRTAVDEGRRALGIDQNPDAVRIAAARCGEAPERCAERAGTMASD